MILVKAKNIKNVPGSKSDPQDCQWTAQMLQHGLPKVVLSPRNLFESCET